MERYRVVARLVSTIIAVSLLAWIIQPSTSVEASSTPMPYGRQSIARATEHQMALSPEMLPDENNSFSSLWGNSGFLVGVQSVAAGENHTCALVNGGVKCWGDNSMGQLGDGTRTSRTVPVDVTGVSGATAIATGTEHTCALVNGGVKCWGGNRNGELGIGSSLWAYTSTVDVVGVIGATAIAASGGHTCALVNGGVKCWGANGGGQLGDGTTIERRTPVDTIGINGATALAAGGGHTCALVNGGVECWGYNNQGQLGDGSGGSAQYSTLPVDVVQVSAATAIVAGAAHTCALLNGGVKCWGRNNYGQLGNLHNGFYGQDQFKKTPIDVQEVNQATAITAGSQHTCALADGEVKCWGHNYYGELGNGTTTHRSIPDAVSNTNGATAITAGGEHTCALIGGGVKCWGRNVYGELGNGTTTTRAAPVDAEGVNAAGSVTAGMEHTCALVAGVGKCWGGNNYGQLGDGTVADRTAPVEVIGLSRATAIATGGEHTCAIVDGGVKCWGNNVYGQLGDGTRTNRNVPVDVDGVSEATAITAGRRHTCVLVDSEIKCWGSNDVGQLGNGTWIASTVPVDVVSVSGATAIAAGVEHMCTLVNGGVKCWGNNNFGQLGDSNGIGGSQIITTPMDFVGLSGVTAIAAGGGHTCALVSGGVKCWGANESGQLGDGNGGGYGPPVSTTPVDVAGLSGATSVTAGYQHTCALVSDEVKCWGRYNYLLHYGLVPADVAGTGGANAITSGYEHTCTLVNGGVKCWGNNRVGQLGVNPGLTPVDVVAGAPDTPPSQITDLTVAPSVYQGSTAAILSWTAPGDDNPTNTAASYEVRYWTSSIETELGWTMATPVNSAPAPLSAGSPQSMTVTGGLLPSLTYWFAIRAVDSAGNRASLSNSPSVAFVAEPVVFIPGIAGSRLKGPNDPYDLWPNFLAPNETVQALLSPAPGVPSLLATLDAQAKRLTRDPASSDYDPNIYAVDVIRRALAVQDIFESFLDYLDNRGRYTPYVLPTTPSQLPGYGCNTLQGGATPNLFVFPYDWRRSNAENAVLLKNYIRDCVRFYHPNSQVNIVTHSMGGLIARRYVLDNLNSHHVKRMITVAAPWLGAPKVVHTLETGVFGKEINFFLVNPDRLKQLVRTFPGTHELLPSRRYFELGGRPLAEFGHDLDGDWTWFEEYDYANYRDVIADLYGAQIEANNAAFHDNPGQDNWANDLSGIEYHHLYGIRNKDDTIEIMTTVPFPVCVWSGVVPICIFIPRWILTYGDGDGTVPLLSALRSPTVLPNTVNSSFHQIAPVDETADSYAEHNGMIRSEAVQECIVQLLAGETCPPVIVPSSDGAPAADAYALRTTSPAPAYYILVLGGGDGYVTDSSGNATGLLHSAIFVNQIPEVTVDLLGDDAFSVVAPVNGAYTVTFKSGETPLSIQITKGTPESTERAVRYQDLVVPPNATLELRLPLEEATTGTLRYDSDEDGAVDTDAQPDAALIGAGAQDTTPPQIHGAVTSTSGGKQVELAASDTGSGVKNFYYSLDGATFQPYTSPFVVADGQGDTVYAFADDNAANRSPLFTLPLASGGKLFLPIVTR